MSIGTVRLTPADHGRRMTWEEYVQSEGDDDFLHELSRGVFTVIDVPHWKHFRRCDLVKTQFVRYRDRFPARLFGIGGGTDSRLPIESLESDRHPDVAIYLNHPPEGLSPDEFWSNWIPEIVIEVVSTSSAVRNYEEKPEEYFQFGVKEYWIIDPQKNEMTVYRRVGGSWKPRIVRPGEKYRTPLLKDFEFDLAATLEIDSGE